jgi:hypothetical protein
MVEQLSMIERSWLETCSIPTKTTHARFSVMIWEIAAAYTEVSEDLSKQEAQHPRRLLVWVWCLSSEGTGGVITAKL